MSAPNNLSKESIAVSEEGEQFALVVGVNNSIKSSYLKPLLYAERDARTMADVLRQTECNFTVLVRWTLLSRQEEGQL